MTEIAPYYAVCRDPTSSTLAVDDASHQSQQGYMKNSCILVAAFLVLGNPALAQTEPEIRARMTPAVHECESAPSNSGTLEQAICYKEEAARQDKKLNDAWIRLIAKTPAIKMKTLRRNERLWIIDRDQNCRHEASYYINSTAAYMYNLCMARENIRRTIWLERGGRGPFAIPRQSGA